MALAWQWASINVANAHKRVYAHLLATARGEARFEARAGRGRQNKAEARGAAGDPSGSSSSLYIANARGEATTSALFVSARIEILKFDDVSCCFRHVCRMAYKRNIMRAAAARRPVIKAAYRCRRRIYGSWRDLSIGAAGICASIAQALCIKAGKKGEGGGSGRKKPAI